MSQEQSPHQETRLQGTRSQTPGLQMQGRLTAAGTARAAVFGTAAELANRMVVSDPCAACSLSPPPRLEEAARRAAALTLPQGGEDLKETADEESGDGTDQGCMPVTPHACLGFPWRFSPTASPRAKAPFVTLEGLGDSL